MKALFITSEAYPFVKTGGLADVAGALPKELKKLGVDIRVVLPLYGQISSDYKSIMDFCGYYYVDLDWRHCYCGLYRLEFEGVTYYFLDNKQYFDRNTLYGQSDDGERFIFFSKAATVLAKYLGENFDIIHSNDWHSAMVNLFVKDFAIGDDYYKNVKTIFTIHNLKYQGVFPSDILKITGLSGRYFVDDGIKFYDAVNFMKAGIVYSDRFNTVSGSYALEIKSEYFGERLSGLIRKYDYKLSGIVNGIDNKVWNPMNDELLIKQYDINSIENKKYNKLYIQDKFSLPRDAAIPMLVIISRLVEMKGLDLVNRVMDDILSENVQVVILGTGDEKFENSFRHYEWRYPQKVRALMYYSEKLSHQLYAAGDFILMPSLSEPCGLSQLIAMEYGTIPIVREAGGLKDTVKAYNDYNKKGCGFTFSNINAHDMLYTVRLALDYYHKEEFKDIIRNAMELDLSWTRSAVDYLKLYREINAER